ncbi:glycoside hydrolase superfamily [Globomyces pollinis-pini]|nr:glycoside hydrolase superfamily [Globomyces pollinis-pini]
MTFLDNFITRRGNKLYENENHFRWASYNVPGYLMTEDYKNPLNSDWINPEPREQLDAVLTVKGSAGRVIRTYTLGFGNTYHMMGPNQFYEPAWVAFDNALNIARQHGIRLIVPFINNHNGGDAAPPGNFGDYAYFTKLHNLPPSQFFNNSILIEDFKNLIRYTLNRINTVNGIRYGDDPTMLAWQLGNELGGWDGPAPPASWSIEMATLIKQLAPKTLVMDGTQGGLDAPNRYPIAALQHPSIDIFSNHYYYGESDYKRITKDSNWVAQYNKAFVLGEVGFRFEVVQRYYDMTLKDTKISGCMVWSLRYHSRDGGFYTHSEEGGFFSYHAPGFPVSPGFGIDDARMVKMIRRYGLLIQNLSSATAFPQPNTPSLSNLKNLTPKNLTWFGSAWAAGYNVYRVNHTSKRKELVRLQVKDCVESGKVC